MAEPYEYANYDALMARFLGEVRELQKEEP
jgi:hypothetical protein